ncbi:unnamed protein product [Gadus morhua 'NCC']
MGPIPGCRQCSCTEDAGRLLRCCRSSLELEVLLMPASGVLCEVLVLSGPHVVGLGLGGAGDTVRTLGCFKMSSIFDLQTLATQKA